MSLVPVPAHLPQARSVQHRMSLYNSRHQCEVCGRRFERKDALSRHKQTHDKTRAHLKSRRRACVRCSKGKIRCSNEHPSCSSCSQRNLPCVYEPHSKQTGANYGSRNSGKDAVALVSTTDSRTESIDVAFPRDELLIGILSPLSTRTSDNSNYGTSLDTSSSPSVAQTHPDNLAGPDLIANSESHDGESASDMNWSLDVENAGWYSSAFQGEPLFSLQAEFALPQLNQAPQCMAVLLDTTQQPGREVNGFFRDWSVGGLPNSQSNEMPRLVDFWPVDFQGDKAQPLIFPSLDDAANCQTQKYFSTRPLSSEEWVALKRCIQLLSEQTLWSRISVDDFPSKEILDHCIDLYFANVHQICPILHRPTFDPGESIIVTLAVVSLGACFTKFAQSRTLSDSISEINRRLLLYMSYITAQLLQGFHDYCCGDGRLFELSDLCRSSIVHTAKCMGLFREVNPRAAPTNDNSEYCWKIWVTEERRRRLGWAIYEFDALIALFYNCRPYLKVEDVDLALPCLVDHWEADSAYAWEALRPLDRASSNLRLGPVIMALLEGTDNGVYTTSNDHHRLLIILTLGRMLLSLQEMRSSPTFSFLQTGAIDAGKRLISVIQRFERDPVFLSRNLTRKEVARAVHEIHVTHTAYLYSAGDLVDLFFPLLHTVLLRQTAEGKDVISRLFQWQEEDPGRARNVAYHCAQVLALARQFPENLTSEPFQIFRAGVLLMAMARLMNTAGEEQYCRAGLRIDHLGGPGDPTVARITQWLLNGGEEVIGVHGVPVLCCRTGWRQILDESVELLRRIRVWGISQCLAHMLLKISNESLGVEWFN
ncbi:fungal-specific transcription factor domain-containing protein [Biscogniauxia mediterranea]|nr:fungal-specific transcription factor domain-containing protein [Biscogniauxia mediterranea]